MEELLEGEELHEAMPPAAATTDSDTAISRRGYRRLPGRVGLFMVDPFCRTGSANRFDRTVGLPLRPVKTYDTATFPFCPAMGCPGGESDQRADVIGG